MDKRKLLYTLMIIVFAGMSLSFRPGLWLVHKPANSLNASYIKGWEDGCITGSNSYSLLFAPLLEHPFIKQAEEPQDASVDKSNYKVAWNEGFTLCRYYQSSVYELMQFGVVVATLLFIGYLVARKETAKP